MRILTTALVAALLLTAPAAAPAATVDGATIHWTSSGRGAQTVVLVHGWTCDETSWREQVPVVSKSYRVITLDLPGHGKSGMPKTFTMEVFARAIEAVRVEAGVDKIFLVGHSMGTPVIRKYALMFPDRVKGLVLVDGLVQLSRQWDSTRTARSRTAPGGDHRLARGDGERDVRAGHHSRPAAAHPEDDDGHSRSDRSGRHGCDMGSIAVV
jgi:pimeloyl-ACP methyl ester carboxylesterase